MHVANDTEKGIKSLFCWSLQIQGVMQEVLPVKCTSNRNSKEASVKRVTKTKKVQNQERWRLLWRLHKWTVLPWQSVHSQQEKIILKHSNPSSWDFHNHLHMIKTTNYYFPTFPSEKSLSYKYGFSVRPQSCFLYRPH